MQNKKKLIICPNEEKLRILKSLQSQNTLFNQKYMTIEEFQNNYFFSYDEKALYYLMDHYHLHIDVAKIYLNSLYGIEDEKTYHKKKLIFLQSLKKELISNHLLEINPSFHDYLKDTEIEIKEYFELEKYQELALGKKIEVPNTTLSTKVMEYETIEEEISGTCIMIRQLLEKGIPFNKIYLSNIKEDYLFLVKKIFSYYQIPINIDLKESIYSTKIGLDYLKTNELDLEKKEYLPINKKIISLLKRIVELEDSPIKEQIKVDLFKNTYLSPKKMVHAVNITDFYQRSFDDDEYLFVLGCNQDILPKMEKDVSYLSDSLKDEVNLYTTDEVNKRRKEVTKYLLSRVKNLTMSYKKSTPFASFYPSSIIEDWNLEVIKGIKDIYNYSNQYNKILLSEMRDRFDLYGEKDENLALLNHHYSIPYKTYSHAFTGIHLDTYQKNLPYPLKLSYTSFNSYNECKFKYYLKYVLKIDKYTDTFAAFLGSFYHKILSLGKDIPFDIDLEMEKYIETRECTLKEKFLLNRIKKELKEFLEILKKQNLLTGYDSEYYEKKLSLELQKEIAVEFVGYIDKIMYYKKISDTYFSIVDYKTGTIDTHLEPMKYYLHMQLPIYLYLIHQTKTIENPIFTGIYYQNILFPYPTWSKTVEEEKEKRYYLNGYSTDQIEILERFDTTYEDSSLIKSLKYKDNKFGAYSKIMDNDTLYQVIKFTGEAINRTTDNILQADFSINPKVYDKKNISCEYCNFKDLCFYKEKDIKYLDKVEDLSFLGGDEE